MSTKISTVETSTFFTSTYSSPRQTSYIVVTNTPTIQPTFTSYYSSFTSSIATSTSNYISTQNSSLAATTKNIKSTILGNQLFSYSNDHKYCNIHI